MPATDTEEKEFAIPYRETHYGHAIVQASSKEEAMEKFEHGALDYNTDYVELEEVYEDEIEEV